MPQLDYTYIFDDLSDGYTSVQWNHHRAHQPSHTFRVFVDDQQFYWKRQHHLSALLADCVDLAIAVAVADRLSIAEIIGRATSMSVCQFGIPKYSVAHLRCNTFRISFTGTHTISGPLIFLPDASMVAWPRDNLSSSLALVIRVLKWPYGAED